MSTTYYALFHFLLEECTNRLVGVGPTLLRRRRIVARVFTHKGLRSALAKVGGGAIEASVQDYFGRAVAPAFIRTISRVFLRAQDQRHAADYDLNASASEASARVLIDDVAAAIAAWQADNGPASRDFKHAVCLLMFLGGRLRRDDS